MSVRATERLIGDVVITPELPNSPKMIVQSVDIEAKLVTTVWFSESQTVQVGVFPATALDRLEKKEPVAATPAKKSANGVKKTKNPSKK